MRLQSFISALCLIAITQYSVPVRAQELSPLIFDLAPEGDGVFQLVDVANSGSAPIAFEVTTFHRTYDEKGEFTDTPSSSSFEITPDAIWIEPGDRKRVLVKWTGEPSPFDSQMHVIVFDQAPIQYTSADGGSAITLRYRFLAITHIVPSKAKSNLGLSEWRREGGTLRIVLENTGNKYGRIDSGDLVIGGPETCAIIAREELSVNYGPTWLLPGARRQVEIALPDECNVSELNVTWPVEAMDNE